MVPDGHSGDAFLKEATTQLHNRFVIVHVTLQVFKVQFTEACGNVFSDNTGAASTVLAGRALDHDH